MHAIYGLPGYRHTLALLSYQAIAFAGLLLGSMFFSRYAVSMSADAGLALRLTVLPLILGLSLFSLRTWTSLFESVRCLDIPFWQPFYRYVLRPLLWLAPVSWLVATLLHSYTAWGDRVPMIVGGAGLLVCSAGLVHMMLVVRHMRAYYRFQKGVLTDLQRQHGAAALSRVGDSLACLDGELRGTPFQMKRGMMFLDLPSAAWHSRAEFPWAAHFERSYAKIRAEGLKAYESKDIEPYVYPGAIQGDWNVFWLVRRGEPVAAAEALCPETFKALQSVPGFPYMREAHFSILRPRSRILPHCDASNAWLTAHFALQVPEACGIRVGRTQRTWKEGEFLFFETTYQHEAWNDSDTPRIILLFDFLNPALTDVERLFYMKTA